jgi:hypothetical protein
LGEGKFVDSAVFSVTGKSPAVDVSVVSKTAETCLSVLCSSARTLGTLFGPVGLYSALSPEPAQALFAGLRTMYPISPSFCTLKPKTMRFSETELQAAVLEFRHAAGE